jgi:hypothetical protein
MLLPRYLALVARSCYSVNARYLGAGRNGRKLDDFGDISFKRTDGATEERV